ncbi:MAG: hypothetical protein M1556_04530 [Candidatus Thermoplasmatota archaeon]|jgi:transposase-like protein|nr:hypothetical protein [Candidatus Thermoplasmatota archaeon]MCL6002892.1 hypothetical protein [Candidatus Thermoplasmatota archaeon]
MICERMNGMVNKIRETEVVNITCPTFEKTFGVEFNPAIDRSSHHSIKNDATKVRGVSTIHMRSERNLKCPNCRRKFVERREWM